MEMITRKYYEYEFEYSLQPGLWMSAHGLNNIERKLWKVNKSSGRNLTFGIFDEGLTLEQRREFYDTANICIIYERNTPVGFFYNIILSAAPTPAIHAGLVLLGKNSGHDLLRASYAHMTYLQYKKFGRYYYTNISSTPSIVGIFADSFTNVWPSHKANQIKPPSKGYLRVLDFLEEQYIKKYFKSGALHVDKKRFVLQSTSREMGFETDLKKLPRYSKPEVNYFCMYWLDYSKGEDLIQVGEVDLRAVVKVNSFDLFQTLKSYLKAKSPPRLLTSRRGPGAA